VPVLGDVAGAAVMGQALGSAQSSSCLSETRWGHRGWHAGRQLPCGRRGGFRRAWGGGRSAGARRRCGPRGGRRRHHVVLGGGSPPGCTPARHRRVAGGSQPVVYATPRQVWGRFCLECLRQPFGSDHRCTGIDDGWTHRGGPVACHVIKSLMARPPGLSLHTENWG